MSFFSDPFERVVFYGGTGQCRVMHDAILKPWNSEQELIAVIDDTENACHPFYHQIRAPFYSGRDAYDRFLFDFRSQILKGEVKCCVTIGNPHGQARKKLSEMMNKDGIETTNIIHEDSYFGTMVEYGKGFQCHNGVIVNPFVLIGKYCILNTRCLVEHDCFLEDCVEIGPGTVLCGNVMVGENSWVGANSTVRQNIKIGKNCIIGAGSVVVKDVPDNSVYVGNPAKLLRKIDG